MQHSVAYLATHLFAAAEDRCYQRIPGKKDKAWLVNYVEEAVTKIVHLSDNNPNLLAPI